MHHNQILSGTAVLGRWSIRTIACLILLLAGFPAQAGFMGNTVDIRSVQSVFPGIPPSDSSLVVSIAGPGAEYDANYDFIDISDDTITIGNNDRHCDGGFCPILASSLGDFFGFRIVDLFDTIAPIIGVSLVSSDIPTFDVGNITFSENEIFVGIEQLGRHSPANVIPEGEAMLEVTFAATAISEPAPAGTFALAIAGVWYLRRRQRVTCGPRG